jgi:AraC-like DNA-binding protein
VSYKIFEISEYIRGNLQNLPTKELLCDKFTITDYALRKGFKQNFGLNIGEYCRKQRMKSAAKLLSDTENSISIVAECVGFRNPSRFAEAFRNQYGVNPFQFRQVVKNAN